MSEFIETAESPEEFVEQAAPQERVNIQSNNAMDEAALAAARGQDPVPVAQAILAEDAYVPPTPEFMKGDYLGKHLADTERRVTGAVADGVPVDIPKVAESLETAVRSSEGPYGEYRAYIDANPQSVHMTEDEKDDAALNFYMKSKSNEILDSMGFNLQTAGDIGAMILTPDVEDLRMSELAKVVGMQFTAMDALDPTEFLGKLSSYIKGLPADKAMKAVDGIVEEWPNILGNNQLMLGIMMSELTGDYQEDMKGIENVLGKVDKAIFLAYPLMVAKNIYKGFNAVNTAVKANNIEGAAALVNKGVKGELASAGVDIEDAASSVMPLASTNGLIAGSNNKLASAIMKQNEEIDLYLGEVGKVNSFGLGMTETEKANAIERGVVRINERPEVADVAVSNVTDTGFSLTYKVDGEDVSSTVAFTVDDVGNFAYKGETGQYSGLDLGIISPNTRFSSDKDLLVQLPEQMQFQSASVRHFYDEAIRKAYAPNGKRLSKTEHQKVDGLLLRGDKEGREWDVNTLVTVGVDGVKFTEREAMSYQGIRRVVDHLYHAKDKQITEGMRANNVKTLEWQGMDVAAKSYDTPEAAKIARTQTDNTRMVAINDGTEVRIVDDISPEDITDLYTQGYKMVRPSRNTYLPAQGTNVEWAMVKGDRLAQPNAGVLGHNVGYMPMIRKEGHFFLKEAVPISVGGKMLKGGQLKTIRYFNNKLDADTYLKQIDPDSTGKYRVLADRELSATERDMEYTNISGGLFTGSRKSERIPFGLDGTEGERVDALGSLGRYVSHLSKQMPYNLYRMGLRERWVESAKSLGALKGGRSDLPFDEMVAGLDEKHTAYRFLADSHSQIQTISGVPTALEQKQRAATTAMALWFEGKGNLGKKIASKLHGKDAISETANFTRSVTFHAMLGSFNPAQFAVQASGALVALSINPILGLKAIPRSMSYAMLDMVPLGKIDNAMLGLERMGIDTEGYKLWKESGVKYSVTSSNVDYHSLTEGVPYDAGLMRRVISNDTFFFKSGELVNARLSFATAYEHWKDLNPGKVAGSKDLKTILARSEQYRLNMTGANSAKFQSGVASVPLQFQQVITKFVEKLYNKDFNNYEKARLVGGQAVLFGGMGIPFLNAFVPSALESLGIDAQKSTPEELNAYKNGVFGWYFQDYLDINSVIGGRMSLGKDLFQNILGATQEAVTLPQMILGPTGNIFDRSIGNLPNVYTALNTIAYADEVGIDKVAAVAEVLARTLVDVPSSSASLVKAYDMTHSKFYKNKFGRPVFEWTENNKQTILFQALGFSPQEVQDWYEINTRKGGAVPGSMQNTDAKRIMKLMNTLHASSDDKKEVVLLAISAIKNKYEPDDQKRLLEFIGKAIKEPKDSWENATKGVVEDWTTELNDGVLSLHRAANVRTNPRIAKELEKAGVK